MNTIPNLQERTTEPTREHMYEKRALLTLCLDRGAIQDHRQRACRIPCQPDTRLILIELLFHGRTELDKSSETPNPRVLKSATTGKWSDVSVCSGSCGSSVKMEASTLLA